DVIQRQLVSTLVPYTTLFRSVQIHDMLYLTSWVAALLCRVLRTPYVVTQHVGMVDHPAQLVRAVQRAVLRTVSALVLRGAARVLERKSTRLNSSHVKISYAVF